MLHSDLWGIHMLRVFWLMSPTLDASLVRMISAFVLRLALSLTPSQCYGSNSLAVFYHLALLISISIYPLATDDSYQLHNHASTYS